MGRQKNTLTTRHIEPKNQPCMHVFTRKLPLLILLCNNYYRQIDIITFYAKQNSLRPHPRKNRERGKYGSGPVEKRRKVCKHRQASFAVSLKKTWWRPRNLQQRKNGERIRESRFRPSERTNFTHCKNEVWIPHNKET